MIRHCQEPQATKQSRVSDCFGTSCLAMTMGALFLLTASFVFAASSSLFTDANAKYQAGDFKSASELYRKLIDAKRPSSAMYYNLGNTALRLNQKGKALVYYERALKASPRDKDLRWNIQILRTTLTDRIEDLSSNPFYTPVERLVHRVTLDEPVMWFTGALAVLALLALLNYLFPATLAWTGFFRTTAVLCLTLFLILFAAQWFETKDPHAVILDKEVTAYYGPSDRETKAFVLHEGAEGKVLDESQDWLYLSLKNKNTGWIRKNSCEIV